MSRRTHSRHNRAQRRAALLGAVEALPVEVTHRRRVSVVVVTEHFHGLAETLTPVPVKRGRGGSR